tara:strand:+ start:724 stop:1134 length:411 start_codon:yes stop_codon:yes gene_type:complete
MNRWHVASVTNIEGDWRLGGYERSVIELKNLTPLLTKDRLENIRLDDIAWKGKKLYPNKSGNNCYCCGGIKYQRCNTKYPLIIAKNASNPFNNKYRMIDGIHRIQKLLLNGKTHGLCYVFDFSEIRCFLLDRSSIN